MEPEAKCGLEDASHPGQSLRSFEPSNVAPNYKYVLSHLANAEKTISSSLGFSVLSTRDFLS